MHCGVCSPASNAHHAIVLNLRWLRACRNGSSSRSAQAGCLHPKYLHLGERCCDLRHWSSAAQALRKQEKTFWSNSPAMVSQHVRLRYRLQESSSSNGHTCSTTRCIGTGAIEVQDEGSQLVAFALAPEEEWDILDACAGAGGKTLHLAQLQRDRGRIIASDADRRRLEQLARRLKRHRYRSIHLANLDGHRSLQRTQFDAVLLDVPCTGSGTVRRAPEIKWRIHTRQLERIVAKQERILEQYHAYVRSGGVLLYATCSLLPEENQRVVERFLARHPEFEPDPLAPAFERYGIALPLSPDQWQFQLLPHRHGTDGFFIARLRRR